MKKLISLLLVLALVFSLAACAGPVPEIDSVTVEAVPAEAAPSEPVTEAPMEAGPVTLTDQLGRQVTLEAPAKTIVSCYYVTTYACMALGVADRIVGLEKKADSRPIYHMAAPELTELPNVGSLKEFNVEAAAALEPDLVIMPKKLRDHAGTLEALGIAVLVVDPETQEGMETMLTLIAAACGVEEKAQALLSYYADQLAKTAERTAGREQPWVYLAGNSSYLTVAPGEMYQSNLITLAGGVNVAGELAGDYWTEVSYESILAMDPEVLVIPCGAAYSREDVLNDPSLADCAAVKSGAVYQMPQQIEEWDSPVPSGILGILWMTSVLHEDAYPFESFQGDAAEYYQEFYGFQLDTALVTK